MSKLVSRLLALVLSGWAELLTDPRHLLLDDEQITSGEVAPIGTEAQQTA